MRTYVIRVDEHENGEVEVNVMDTKVGGYVEKEISKNKDSIIDSLSLCLKRYFGERNYAS